MDSTVKDWTSSTTIHGVAELSKDAKSLRCLMGLFITISLGFCTYEVARMVEQYAESPTATSIS